MILQNADSKNYMTFSSLEPYIKKPADWMAVIKDRHILFDADAIITILSQKAEAIFDDFKDLNVKNCIIHPVYVELQRIDKESEIFKRLKLISDHDFSFLPILKEELEHTNAVQSWLYRQHC